jgi:hypothetical protein
MKRPALAGFESTADSLPSERATSPVNFEPPESGPCETISVASASSTFKRVRVS